MVYFGFMAGNGDTRGLLHLPVGDGMNVRFAMLVAAGWFVVFALPLLLTHMVARAGGRRSPARRCSVLSQAVEGPGRRVAPRPQPGLLPVASAVFRDGLAGVFTFGGCSVSTSTDSRRPMC